MHVGTVAALPVTSTSRCKIEIETRRCCVQFPHFLSFFVYLSFSPLCPSFSPVPAGVITFVNCFSVQLATKVQNVFTAAKLVAIGIIVVGGVYMISIGTEPFFSSGPKPIGRVVTTSTVVPLQATFST